MLQQIVFAFCFFIEIPALFHFHFTVIFVKWVKWRARVVSFASLFLTQVNELCAMLK